MSAERRNQLHELLLALADRINTMNNMAMSLAMTMNLAVAMNMTMVCALMEKHSHVAGT